MVNERDKSVQGDDLRSQAEELLRDGKGSSAGFRADEGKDALFLVHELQVHQIELEMQNEELKRAKLEAEDSLAKYTDLYDFAPIGLFNLDEQGVIKETNLAGAALLGIGIQNLLGRRFPLFVALEDRISFNNFIKNVFKTSARQTGEFSLVRDEESTFYAHIVGTATKDHPQNGRQCLIAVIDITQRKQAEEALRESEERFRVAQELSPDGFTILRPVRDEDGNIIDFTWVYENPAIARMNGTDPQAVVGRRLLELFPGHAGSPFFDVYREVAESGSGEERVLEAPYEGETISTQKWFRVVVVSMGEDIAILAQEITDRKRAEESLQKSRDELELKVQERTVELSDANADLVAVNEELRVEILEHETTEKELLKAKESAEAAANAKAAFMANMSHELRTPMNFVLGMASILLDEPLTPEQKDYVKIIKEGGDAMMAHINNILDFSKSEKEKVVLELQPLSLHALVEESMELIASQACKKSLNLAYTIKYGTPDNIVGDHGRLLQVLVSMLSNAVKFTDVGDVSISISSKPLGENKYQVLFTVKDTGIGTPQDKMNELFLPFSKVETIISRKRDGIGLGLAISKRLVGLMGGEIWATSTLGEGSTFCFTIEAEVAPGKLAQPEISSKPVENLAEQYPLRILVAEDSPSNQKVLVDMLKRMGYRADVVADGREVLQALEIQSFDLILMDVKMPEMDGLEACRQIRRRWPLGPKIIAITAYAFPGDREKCLEAGMDDYISKPVQMSELSNMICKHHPSGINT